MQSLKIHDVGLAPDASNVFHSMLRILDGRTTAAWQLSPIEQADVLLVHAGSRSDALERWSRTGKPVVFLVDDRASRPPTLFVLRYPFRVMQLMAMLDQVSEHLNAPRPGLALPQSAWAAATSLRELGTGGGDGWHVARDDAGTPLWISGGMARATGATLERLRAGDLALGAFTPSEAAPEAAAAELPSHEVAWFVGLHCPAERAPWMTQDASWRLRRWPDFGRLGAHAMMMDLCALLSTRASTAAALAASSGHALGDVQRFLTAASLAGLLASAPRTAMPEGTPPPRTGWMRLVGELRRHLGLVS